ncbi:MAG: hypothetical protein HGA75_14430, partial [Thiobacillus sp.]|nr:hypothetical protein [Thiobacillus sp.]
MKRTLLIPLNRRSREGGSPVRFDWIPACAGMTIASQAVITGTALVLALCSISLPAWAGDHGRAIPLPAVYKNECGSCHTPFPAGLRSAAGDGYRWRERGDRCGPHGPAPRGPEGGDGLPGTGGRNAGPFLGSAGGPLLAYALLPFIALEGIFWLSTAVLVLVIPWTFWIARHERDG